MKNTNKSLSTFSALVAVVLALTLTACGGGSNDTPEATPTPTPGATTPTPSPTPTPTPAPKRVSKVPEIYYFDDAGQWRLMPGVTPKQALDVGVLCKYPTDEGTRNAYLAAGRTLDWIAANIFNLDLCPGY